MATMDEFAHGSIGGIPGSLGYQDRILALPDAKPGVYDDYLIKTMLITLRLDLAEYDLCRDYLEGRQLLPYAPRHATEQIRDLQRRSIANWMPLLVNLPSQMSFVDDYRRRTGGKLDSKTVDDQTSDPEWELWQKNRMDSRQSVIYRSCLTYGHSFVAVNNIDPNNVTFDILPTRHTVAYFRDPVNDIRPAHVLTIMSYPRTADLPGMAIYWDDKNRWELVYDFDGSFRPKGKPFAHGLGKCPIVRYTCFIDDEGRTMGVVKPAIPLQDRLNQATFSTNVTADFGAFKVRYAAGLVPDFRRDEHGDLVLDERGEPIPVPVEISQSQLLLSDDPATKFGQLEETPLSGYIEQEEQAARNFTTLSQFPPLASISNLANLSAEAWGAAEAQFIRWIDSLHVSFGESHEELLRTGALAIGDTAGSESYGGEVRWRDMSTKTIAVMMDALGKAAQMLDVPKKGLWPLIPDVTKGMLDDWETLHEQAIQDAMQMDPLAAQQLAAGDAYGAIQTVQLRSGGPQPGGVQSASKPGVPKPSPPGGTPKKPLRGNAA